MSRRLIIPDIHGCAKTLRALLDQVAPSPTDTLYFLGDYIDRGPDSAGVLEVLLELQAQHVQLVLLRGNHEENFMKLFREWADDPLLFERYVRRINKAGSLLDVKGHPIERYWRLMESTQYVVVLSDTILVHAGLKFSLPDPFADRRALVEIREMDYDGHKVDHRQIIHGHTPTSLEEIEANLEANTPLIPLDNGCVFAPSERKWLTQGTYGYLLCLDLDTRKMTKQAYVE